MSSGNNYENQNVCEHQDNIEPNHDYESQNVEPNHDNAGTNEPYEEMNFWTTSFQNDDDISNADLSCIFNQED